MKLPYSAIVVGRLDLDELKKVGRVVLFDKEKILIEDVKEVIKEAFLAEEGNKIIVLKADSFTIEAQNSLLKVLEEHPKNVFFIINTKAKLLDTIYSRLPVIKNQEEKEELKIDLPSNLEELFNFIKSYNREDFDTILKEIIKKEIGKGEKKELIQKILFLKDISFDKDIYLLSLLL